MEKFRSDYGKVSKDIVSPKRLSYERNKHLFRKVAFDVFQMDNGQVPTYWILEKCDDGEYLVATYEDEKEIKSESSWSALSDKENKHITLSYKNIPIRRFAVAEFNVEPKETHILKEAMVEKLDKDSDFVNKLLNTLPEEKKASIMSLFPELIK